MWPIIGVATADPSEVRRFARAGDKLAPILLIYLLQQSRFSDGVNLLHPAQCDPALSDAALADVWKVFVPRVHRVSGVVC